MCFQQRNTKLAAPMVSDIFAPYSSVFISSRFYRTFPGDQPDEISTPDALKRFMATEDKWSYISDKYLLDDFMKLGVRFQGAVSTTMGTKDSKGHIPGEAISFEGKQIIAPWMTWNAPWGCINNPEYYQIVFKTACKYIEAGSSDIQHDDFKSNISLYSFSTGCFCEYCLNGFRKYLEENINHADLMHNFGIDNIKEFNYKTYIIENYHINTDTEYISKMRTIPLYSDYYRYQLKSCEEYFMKLRNDLSVLAGTGVKISANSFRTMAYITKQDQVLNNIYDYAISEHQEEDLGIENIVVGGSIYNAIGKPVIVSSIPSGSNNNVIRKGLAYSYALGHFMLIPWDVYVPYQTPRYFCNIEDYGDLYSFIRENNFLFDGYEIPAKIGILVNWEDITAKTLNNFKDYTMKVFDSNIPFKFLMVAYDPDYPEYYINPEHLNGLDYIIAYSDIDSLCEQDKRAVIDSGIKVMDRNDITEQWLCEQRRVIVACKNNEKISSIIRADGINTSLHLVNTGDSAKLSDIQIGISSELVPLKYEAWLYRPGMNPKKLDTRGIKNGIQIKFDHMEEWAVISLTVYKNVGDKWDLPREYCGFTIGNPTPTGEASGNNKKMVLKSNGKGINVKIPGDIGTQDRFTFIYQHIECPVSKNYSISCKITDMTGGDAGLMIRESPASNAPFVCIRYSKDIGFFMDKRINYNDTVKTIPLEIPGEPKYLKLEKVGTIFRISLSENGRTWIELAKEVDMSLKVAIAGIFNTAKDYIGIASTTFERIHINQ